MVPLRVAALAGLLAIGAGCQMIDAGPDPDPGGKADDPDALSSCGFAAPNPIGRASFGAASELSGLVVSRAHAGVLWTVNDGDDARLFAMSRTGNLLATIELPVEAQDWEDLAIGPGPVRHRDYIYIADTGDNDLDRKTVTVHRLVEPDPSAAPIPTPALESFTIEYGDGREHDAEALFVDPISGRLFIVTKRSDSADKKSKLFASDEPLGPSSHVVLRRLLTEKRAPHLDGAWVSADISPDGDAILLSRKEGDNLMFERALGASPEAIEDALIGDPCRAPRSPGKQEAVAFSAAGGGYYMVPEGKVPAITFTVQGAACPRFASATAAGTLESPLAAEISGVAFSRQDRGVLWAINDSGDVDRDVLLAFDAIGATRAAYRLDGVDVNVDWEDVAIGPTVPGGADFVWIGDIGDNDGERERVRVHRLPEPSTAGADPSAIAPVGFETIELVYDDGESHDAESLAVDPRTGDLVVVTRLRNRDKRTSMFVARAPLVAGEVHVLSRVASIEPDILDDAATAADIELDGGRLRLALRLRGKRNLIFTGHPDSGAAELLATDACVVDGGNRDADAIAFDGAGGLLLVDEAPAAMTRLEAR